MKRLGLVFALVVSCSHPQALVTSKDGPAIAKDPEAEPLVVHEWGTFTTLQGAQGGSLDGLQHETEALPPFVHALTIGKPSPFAAYGDTSLDVPVHHVGGKMETPVMYFHTKTARHVKVSVDFTNGVMSHWWPRGDLAPALAPPVDVSKIGKTTLTWDLDLVPGDQPPPGVPAVAKDDPWSFARETTAAWVKSGNEAERYVFYRGLGRMNLPMFVDAMPGSGRILVRDCGSESLSTSFALEIGPTQGRFVKLDELGPHSGKLVSFADGAWMAKDALVTALSEQVSHALVAEGLYEDEARAMVRTWSRTWFAQEGTRMIYVVPRATTDAILPLHIEPAPGSIVRVLVGRHEFLTPEKEKEVSDLLKARLSTDPAVRTAAMKSLAKLGRFLEPTVRRLVDVGDAQVKKSGTELLGAFDPR